MSGALTNWAGNLTYGALNVLRPASVDQLQTQVAKSHRIRAIGSRHSFNRLADSDADLVSTAGLTRVLDLDTVNATVTIEAGVTYGQLGAELSRRGWALANMASLPHISVVGACATATHGSGNRNGNLATSMVGCRLVVADGSTLDVNVLSPFWKGIPVSLGALGIIVEATLAVEPAYEVAQTVYEQLTFEALVDHFDEITGSAYSVSVFTDWQGDTINQVWRKVRIGKESASATQESFFGASPAIRPLNPLGAMSADNCTDQLGVPGSWNERLPHFRMGFTPSQGDELQAEYLVPRVHAVDAIREVRKLAPQLAPHLYISEIRTVAADELWLSPAFEQPCVCIHFTLKQHVPELMALLPVIESVMEPFAPRPHWGKLFTMPPERVRALYPRLEDFQLLASRLDPGKKFSNDFVDRYVLG